MASSSSSKERSTTKPWSREDIPDLVGKVAIVTGGTGGIGYETAIGLVTAGAEVFIVGRNEEKGNKAVEQIKSANSTAKISFLQTDLGSLGAVSELAKNFNAREIPLDILINNAGITAPPTRQTTTDGFEAIMGTNHLSQFALTAQLLPSLKRSSSARVVNVASAMATNFTHLDFEDFQSERKKYSGTKLYAQSKLANILFAFELQRRSDANGWGIVAIAVHPGLVKTDLIAKRETFLEKFVGAIVLPIFGQEASVGAHPSLFAATSSVAKGGEYYGPKGLGISGPVTKVDPPNPANNLKTAEKLWQVSEQLTKVSWD